MSDSFLDNVYDLDSAEKTRGYYDKWAGAYDDTMDENGYATPDRCAIALAAYAPDLTIPILDIGCGSGISGAALKKAGFTTIDGCDFSAEMLAIAGQKSVYRHLTNTDLENPFPFEQGSYSALSAVGVLNPGHAPATTMDEVLGLLDRDGLFVFSLNDHALEDYSYEARLNEHLDAGTARLLFKEHGTHLPKIDLKSTVYVLQKM